MASSALGRRYTGGVAALAEDLGLAQRHGALALHRGVTALTGHADIHGAVAASACSRLNSTSSASPGARMVRWGTERIRPTSSTAMWVEPRVE